MEKVKNHNDKIRLSRQQFYTSSVVDCGTIFLRKGQVLEPQAPSVWTKQWAQGGLAMSGFVSTLTDVSIKLGMAHPSYIQLYGDAPSRRAVPCLASS